LWDELELEASNLTVGDTPLWEKLQSVPGGEIPAPVVPPTLADSLFGESERATLQIQKVKVKTKL
jgi:hypothetical protein